MIWWYALFFLQANEKCAPSTSSDTVKYRYNAWTRTHSIHFVTANVKSFKCEYFTLLLVSLNPIAGSLLGRLVANMICLNNDMGYYELNVKNVYKRLDMNRNLKNAIKVWNNGKYHSIEFKAFNDSAVEYSKSRDHNIWIANRKLRELRLANLLYDTNFYVLRKIFIAWMIHILFLYW